jgi:hypothetical protein
VLRGQTQAAYGGCATSIKSQHLPPVRALRMTTSVTGRERKRT